jgi:uncharacterized glyoxalase superfamily protein PhnB
MPPQLNAIGIVVKDMPRALSFYRAMGLAIPAESDSEPHVEAEVNSGLKILWDRIDVVRSFDPEWTPPTGGARVGLAFQMDSPNEVNALYKSLVEAGFEGHKEPWDAFWGQRYALIRDPDGNSVDLYAPLS